MTTISAPLLYWSIRRELWEHRAIYIAPLAVAALILLGFVASISGLPEHVRAMAIDPGAGGLLALPYNIAAVVILVVSVLVSALYSLSALHNERRDRSILFWKSLPVSDTVTVVSKALVPLAVIPTIVIALVMALQLAMLLVSSVVLLLNNLSPLPLWNQIHYVSSAPILIYGTLTTALWMAPVWAWFLLVSGWAKRTPFLWAVLPPVALGVVEKMSFGTSYVMHLLGDRLSGGMQAAFRDPTDSQVLGPQPPHMDPLHFLSTPGLWLGLAFAAACLAVAVYLRRDREPI